MSRDSSTPQDKSTMSLMLGIMVGAILAIGIGLFIYLWNPFNQGKSATVEETSTIRMKEQTPIDKPTYEFYDVLKEKQADVASQPVVTATPKPTKQPVKTNPETTTENAPIDDTGEITHDLPDLTAEEVDDTAVATTNNGVETQSAVVDVQSNKVYFLRINSFDNSDDADQRRAEVLMAGVDAQIVKRRLHDGSEVFEVISRVMQSEQQIMEARQRLQNNGIEAIVAEQPRK